MSVSSVSGGGFTGFTVGSPATTASSGGLPGAKTQTPEDEFKAWASMTPAQQMRATMLASMGLTEDKLKAMSPADQKKVNDEIAKRIKDHVQDQAEKKSGLIADVKV
jgi:TPP-dependent pyruvate/acetoin dehydrogenase alpha subunit